MRETWDLTLIKVVDNCECFLNFGFCLRARNNQKEETNQCNTLNVKF